MTTSQFASGLIDVGAARVYYESHGQGPALLLITGGGGDAGMWDGVVPELAKDHTVVTYDRRGSSRSPRPDGWTATSMDEHARDAAALLRALELAPATVVGHSGGASIACALVANDPGVVRHAVLYEPPLLAVVPGGAEIIGGFRVVLDQAMAEGGPRRAMEMFIRANAGDAAFEAWRASTDTEVQERVFNSAETFFTIELPAFTAFVPDRDRMRDSGVPLTVVLGGDNRDTWYGAAARWLVEGTGASIVELPGGHGGFVTHPDEFAALLRRIEIGPSVAARMKTRV